MDWKKIGAVVKREYMEHIRRKAFWIFTILMPLVWVAFLAVQILTSQHISGTKSVAVVDRTGLYGAALSKAVAASDNSKKMSIQLWDTKDTNDADVRAELKAAIDARKLDAYLFLDAASISNGKVAYRAASVSDFAFQEKLQSYLNQAILTERLAKKGLGPEDITFLEKRVSIDAHRVDERSSAGFFATFILFIFLYATMIQYGFMNLRGVIEEKTNRIVEIVISSVRPTELMLGKIFGIGLVGLTQYSIWSILAANLALLSGTGIAAMLGGGQMPTVPLAVIGYFILFFLLGYFLYAAIYTAIGAPFNSDQEAQQLAMFPTMMIVSVWAFWPAIMNNPNSTFSTVVSFIPFLTPLAMFFRVTLAPVPAWQVGLSVVIMLLSIAAMAWFAGKIYRVGILMYGKKPTVPEIFRWMRYGEKAAASPPEPRSAAAAP